MDENLRFILTILMPVAATLLFALLGRFTVFGKIGRLPRQLIIGAVFAASAIIATQWGLEGSDSVINVRDASPICAAFAFGPVPGVISAVAGGAYRLLAAVLWQKGVFSVAACSASTVLIGVAAAFIPKLLRLDRKPSLFFVMLFSVLSETTHMLLIFLTNIDNTPTAYKAVSSCILPMILLTTLISAVSYALALIIGGNRRDLFVKRERRGISDVMERIVVLGMLVAFLFTSIFTLIMQTNSSVSRTKSMLEAQLDTFMSQIGDACYSGIFSDIINIIYFTEDGSVDSITGLISQKKPNDLNGDGITDEEDITELLSIYSMMAGFDEVDLISKDKKIIHSSSPEQIGKTYENEAFYSKVEANEEYIETEVPNGSSYACAGVTLNGTDGVLSGTTCARFLYTEEKLAETIRQYIFSSPDTFRFGNAGVMFVLTKDESDDDNYFVIKPLNTPTSDDLPDYVTFFDPEKYAPGEFTQVEYNGETEFMIYTEKYGMYCLAMLDKETALLGGKISIMIFTLMETVLFAVVSLILYFGIQINIIKNINRVNSDLGRICGGDLDVTVNVDSTTEFSELSGDINSTVGTLKRYIEAESKRIDDELALARTIQTSSLPRVFPPFPDRGEFDIYAKMITAKKVGGDFYDFFFTDNDSLAFLIADVSGKGIPAALFMMTARVTIKNIAMQRKPIDEVFESANKQLCETNTSKMFVTAWMGILNTVTGELKYVNAGHNPPLLYQNGSCKYLKGRTGFVLAGLKKSRYEYKTIQLSKGDRILLYTDGVTEAKNQNGEFYGEDRLLNLMNGSGETGPKEICGSVIDDVDEFSSGCEQADDITVLSVCYRGSDKAPNEERRFGAEPENTSKAIAYVFETIIRNGCPETTANLFRICTDEIFSNIAKYAYPEPGGEALIQITTSAEKIMVSFTDSGVPFNPLKYMNRELNLPAAKRKPGGLGIHLVKKLMDETTYSGDNEKNKLTIVKYL